jgi:hypothetical protein
MFFVFFALHSPQPDDDNPGATIARSAGMNITSRFSTAALLGAALIVPVAITPVALRAEDHRTYHDKEHNDDHAWNDHEDRAYRIWIKENHRKYRDFGKIKEDERQSYWAWRHNHSDAQLKIEVR